MAAKDKPLKRKQIPGSKPQSGGKKPKLVDSKRSAKPPNSDDSKKKKKNPFGAFKQPQSGNGQERKAPMSKRERRIHAKVDSPIESNS